MLTHVLHEFDVDESTRISMYLDSAHSSQDLHLMHEYNSRQWVMELLSVDTFGPTKLSGI